MKNIVIIGCSRGIGRELVLYLSQSHKVLALSRNTEKLKDLKINTNVACVDFDISKRKSKETLSKIIKTNFDTVDILINNAGYLINKPFLEITLEDMEYSYATNTFGILQSCQATVPYMLENGGHIVNIGSMGGFQGSSKFPGLSVYSSSKAAVASLSECLAEELKYTEIKVNCLALGAAQTEMLNEAFPGYKAPLSAKEMAMYIADFSLNSSHWINGKIIPVSKTTP
jgi:short-subunit dehydrogenase